MIRVRQVAVAWFVALSLVHAGCSVRAASEDERILHDAELPGDGPSLIAFFQARARLDVDGEQLRQLMAQFAAKDKQQRAAATVELIGLGPAALQALRQSANDLDHPDVAERAVHCLPWLEGPSSHKLLIAAAHRLAESKPPGAADALLAYLPYAEAPGVIEAVNAALVAVAAPRGKPEPALLRGLSDRMGVRRAAAGVALCRAVPPDAAPDVRKLLTDRAPEVRLRAAKALAEAHDAEAIPVLIDLLTEVSASQRQAIEELLKQLAGEWAPNLDFPTDDEVSRGVRRDAWAAWWRRTEGPVLLAVIAKHTLTPDKRHKIQQLLAQLGSDDFHSREEASRQLLAYGRLALPLLREAATSPHPPQSGGGEGGAEAARRAKLLIERLETGPDVRLPIAALRLLAVRKPAGAVEALLAYLPFAEDEDRQEGVRKSLIVLARRDGKLDPALRRALADSQPGVRTAAAEALIQGGGTEGHAAVRQLLRDGAPPVRMRVALAMARAGEREGVSVLIELLSLLSADDVVHVERALYQLAGDAPPQMPMNEASNDGKKRREAWAAWWKINAPRADLSRLSKQGQLGYTLVCTILPQGANDSIYEIDRQGRKLWSIAELGSPVDAVVLAKNRVLIAEAFVNRVTERDFKGRIVWQMEIKSPLSVQRLPNGNTFIANESQLLEVDATGKKVHQIDNLPSRVVDGYRLRTGAIVCLTQESQCRILDKTGKQLRSFAIKYPFNEKVGADLDLLPNDHFLITSRGVDKVMEYDSQGKLLHEWNAPKVSRATGLPNGHILVASGEEGRVYELDRESKIVWQHQGVKTYLARRR